MAVTDFSQANIAMFSLTSAGAAYDITLPFEADTIEWWNYTKYGTNSENLSGIWINGMPAGDALIVARGTTDLTSTLETSNGVTELDDGSGFAATQFSPTAITKAASGGVVTYNNHGLVDGQFIRATNFRATPVADATGMYSLNNQLFQVGNVTTNTFVLYYPYTNLGVDTSGETTYVNNGVAQMNLVGESLYTQNAAPVYQYTLGSAVMGNASDVIYIRAIKANQYTALGSV